MANAFLFVTLHKTFACMIGGRSLEKVKEAFLRDNPSLELREIKCADQAVSELLSAAESTEICDVICADFPHCYFRFGHCGI